MRSKEHSGPILTAVDRIINKTRTENIVLSRKPDRECPRSSRWEIKGEHKVGSCLSFGPETAEHNTEPLKMPNVLLYIDYFPVHIREYG